MKALALILGAIIAIVIVIAILVIAIGGPAVQIEDEGL